MQSKHIQPENGIAEALYSGECRWGGSEAYILTRRDAETYSIDMGGGKSSCVVLDDKSPTLTCTHYGEPAVAYGIEPGVASRCGGGGRIVEEATPTLRAKMGDNQLAVAYGKDS